MKESESTGRLRTVTKSDSTGRLRNKHNPNQKTVVIKVGTSSLVEVEKHTLNLSNLVHLCEVVRDLKEQGHQVVVVSSGAVGAGCLRLGLNSKPASLAKRQALAAVGQVHLMRYYADAFSAYGLACAQVLLTLENLASRGQYLNARNTFEELFSYGTVPIVNENDTVAVEQIRFGDNDTLSAQVATLVAADWLFLLTDVDCLYTANPFTNSDAKPIHEVGDMSSLQVSTGDSVGGTQWGTGGMATKLTAARIATAAGCTMVICNAADPRRISEIIGGAAGVGTIFRPHPFALRGRKRWIVSVPVKGEVWLDAGAVRAVKDRGNSLFAAGIVKVTGEFHLQDCVRLCNAEGVEFGRGLVNYGDDELRKVQGMTTEHFQEELGYMGSEEIVHRDNVSLLTLRDSSVPLVALPEEVAARAAEAAAHADRADRALHAVHAAVTAATHRSASAPSAIGTSGGVNGVRPQGGNAGHNQNLSRLHEHEPSVAAAASSSSVLDRLEALKLREAGEKLREAGEAGSEGASKDTASAQDNPAYWRQELEAAIQAEQGSASGGGGPSTTGMAGTAGQLDITDEGWMP